MRLARRLLAALAFAALAALAFAAGAHASATGPVGPATPSVIMGGPIGPATASTTSASTSASSGLEGLTLSALAVTGLVSVLLPIVTGLVTKYRAPAIVKGLTALAVSAVNGLVMGGLAVDGSAHIAKTAIVLALVSFAIQTASYLGVYQPIDANARLLPDAGIGREDPSR